MRFRRKLYPRGGSHETTLPKPLLFELDPDKKYDVVFDFNPETRKWELSFEERGDSK